jgi:hypothetical protein
MPFRSRLQLDEWGQGLDGELLIFTNAGAEGGNRTHDLRITNALLYP